MIILTIGYIPQDWSENTEGEDRILIGDPMASNTQEVEFEITDEGFINRQTNELIDDMFEGGYRAACDASKVISNKENSLPPFIVENIHDIALEEAEETEDRVIASLDDMSEFENEAHCYNGCFYVRYLVEEDDEIEEELVFIVQ